MASPHGPTEGLLDDPPSSTSRPVPLGGPATGAEVGPEQTDGGRPGSRDADGLRYGEPGGLAERFDGLMGRLDALRDRPVAALGAATMVLAVVVGGWLAGRPGSATPVEARIPFASTSSSSSLATAAPPSVPATGSVSDGDRPTEMLVHVAGAVRRPGIVTLDAGARIGEAVDAAGGPTADADLHRLNLAAPVVDGLQIRVPVEGEAVSATGVPPATPGSGDGTGALLVDPNSASEAELQRLPGIGPALAAAIVEWRTTRGPFATADDLLAVPGIGPATLNRLAPHLAL